jgi:hypothetical protein
LRLCGFAREKKLFLIKQITPLRQTKSSNPEKPHSQQPPILDTLKKAPNKQRFRRIDETIDIL